jgi:hypothetical protein
MIDDDEWEQSVEWLVGETEVLGENLPPGPLCPPQIPHDPTCARTRAAWAMARPAQRLRHPSPRRVTSVAWNSLYFQQCRQTQWGANHLCTVTAYHTKRLEKEIKGWEIFHLFNILFLCFHCPCFWWEAVRDGGWQDDECCNPGRWEWDADLKVVISVLVWRDAELHTRAI